MIDSIRSEVARLRRLATRVDHLAQLSGKLACSTIHGLRKLQSLSDAEFKVSSQWGEDGIIEWLVHALEIPHKTFVEFGVENYLEANTRFLLQNRNWRGVVIDGSQTHIESIKGQEIYWRHDLKAVSAFISRDNINKLIETSGLRGDIGLLSVDIDGNDYWVWEAIEVVSPVICVCEYNAVFGDLHPISVPYHAEFDRTRAHSSNLYFGASIGALQHLARNKGYEFAGTNLAGVNAFFVRRDYWEKLRDRIETFLPKPSLFRESRNSRGELTYLSGLDRAREISTCPVVDVVKGETRALGELEPLYSAEWQKQIA